MSSVFADHRTNVLEAWKMQLEFTGRIVGGCPKDPKLVEGWLRKNMGIVDESELQYRMVQHLREMGVDIPVDATRDQIAAATEGLAGEIKTQGFKRGEDDRPYIESRQVKAMIKESANIVWAGGNVKFGRYVNTKGAVVGGKMAKPYIAERAFVKPDIIPIADEITGVELTIGHVPDGFGGTRSTIGYVEYVEGASADLWLVCHKDCLTLEQWASLWTHAELNGLGALRSQGNGQFVVTEFEQVAVEDVPVDLGVLV